MKNLKKSLLTIAAFGFTSSAFGYTVCDDSRVNISNELCENITQDAEDQLSRTVEQLLNQLSNVQEGSVSKTESIQLGFNKEVSGSCETKCEVGVGIPPKCEVKCEIKF